MQLYYLHITAFYSKRRTTASLHASKTNDFCVQRQSLPNAKGLKTMGNNWKGKYCWKRETVWHRSHWSHSLVSENVSILVGVEGQFKDAVHNAPLDSHLGILQLVLTRILPNGITGHGTVQVAQKILHCFCLVIRCCATLERWRGAADTTDVTQDSTTELSLKGMMCMDFKGNKLWCLANQEDKYPAKSGKI